MSRSSYFFNKFFVFKLHLEKLGYLNLFRYLLHRIFIEKNGIIRVSLPGYSYPIYLRNCQSDTQIFTQIFLREELKVNLPITPITIIDGGANIGLATIYLKKKYPQSTVYCIEPDQSNFKILQMNTNPYKTVICYNYGLWNRNATLKIVNSDAGNESFRVEEVIESVYDGIKAITLNEIVTKNNIQRIDLLKLDIEGSEQKVFYDNYSGWLSITDNLMVEIHNWLDSRAEQTVMRALNDKFKYQMAGEYHFFSRK